MTDPIQQHAEAILRALDIPTDSPTNVEAILTACQALFDAGAIAMQFEATQAVFATPNPYPDNVDQQTFNGFFTAIIAAGQQVQAIKPASLRGTSHE